MTQTTELSTYRSFFETILTYGSNAAASHLTNAFCYLDNGDLLPCDPTAADAKNKGFIRRCDRIKQSKEFQIYGGMHTDMHNVRLYLRLQIKLTKAKSIFYLMNKDAESKKLFKFLDSQLLGNRVKHRPPILFAHNAILAKGALAR